MDILVPALVGDMVSRLISSLVAKYQRQSCTTDKLVRLQQLLLRACSIVEEAEGRHISNQGMLLQLKQLMKDMYRGYYVLDTFNGNAAANRSLNLNKLHSALESLEAKTDDMREFVVFLVDCPRIFRQPYITYFFMEKCMFGRNIEKQRIINFLFQPCDSSLSVLPIIGPPEVGKTTLVEHVCSEERVREYFPRIIHLNGDDLRNLEDGSFIRNMETAFSTDHSSLIIIDLVGDIDDDTWSRLSLLTCCRTSGSNSKAILISTKEKVSSMGTTPSLRLKKLGQDEYWYFFRALAFGSTNPEGHQELASMADEIATQLGYSFLGANIVASLLRANLTARFWRYMLEFVRKFVQCHILVLGEPPSARIRKLRPYYLSDYVDGPLLLCRHTYQVTLCSLKGKLPGVRAEDILTGKYTVPSEGSFDLLRWQSPIAPYYSYIASCIVQKPQHVVPKQEFHKRKRGS